jgi:hypothetical protein
LFFPAIAHKSIFGGTPPISYAFRTLIVSKHASMLDRFVWTIL